MADATPPRSLLDHRLVIVTGKGGTGKTTVTCALALAAAEKGLRVLVAEIGREAHAHRLLAEDAQPSEYEPRELSQGVYAMRIDPYEALGEYLGLQIGLRALVDRVLAYPGFRQLMGASPGWRELITLGKVWHMERMRDGDRPRYDLIVVDAPATGHGVTFLDVPRVVVSAVRAGPLRNHTERVEALIADRSATLLLPVALAEELPVRETVQLIERVREQVRIHLDRVVVNAVHPPPFPADLGDLDVHLAELPPDLELGGLPEPGVLAACARYLRSRHELNARYVTEIRRGTGLPTLTLPYLRDGVNGPGDLVFLGRALIATPAAARS